MLNPKTLAPQLQPPVDRIPSGQLPSALTELNEAALNSAEVLPGSRSPFVRDPMCSYDGDEE